MPKNKFQSVSFESVDACLAFIPSQEREIVVHLRQLIFKTIPEVKEKLSYNVPFYFRKERICFIWPCSIPWGGIKEGVQLGFANGAKLNDEFGYLTQSKGKSIATKLFFSVADVDEEIVIRLLEEALLLDEISS
ncbi:DUF1801 domain-containing protein [Nodularia spumigena]|uniref:DUF1801 domain-containing protein n=1 Tax=Nodularia spumigena TaxID=70799 RepID=UPI002B1FAA49|nr:DUF1801 domain-containing protein [Nodularia spumigena]MEA5557352.1 DUF1801 domain-containing protein [Nodularia spumigena CH309]